MSSLPWGVDIDFTESGRGVVKVQPKQSRVSKVIEVGCAALGCDLLSVADARSLAGVLRYLREGHFGRTGASVLNALSDHIKMGGECGMPRGLREGLEMDDCLSPRCSP